jgi:two-component system, OmpR family, response regulator
MRILVVEDDSDIQEFIKVGLEAEGFAVDTIGDGEKALYMARVNEYDLILLDYALPKKNGYEVCVELRRHKKPIPILVLSVTDTTHTKINFLNAGADDYLTKPFSFEELLARVKALLRRPAKLEGHLLEIDDLVMDVNRHIVSRSGRGIYLTKKEFSLLEYFLKNKGVVLSRGKIMEHVWDLESDPFSNTVEAHILNLRRKINAPRKKELIHNIPGRGYKLDVSK